MNGRNQTERPIIFSGPMVRAILEGRKTQTRRVIRNPSRLLKLSLDVQKAVEWKHCRDAWWTAIRNLNAPDVYRDAAANDK